MSALRPNARLGGCSLRRGAAEGALRLRGRVSVSSELSLREQLLRAFGGGFELHTWSELPHGSGTGEWGPVLLHTARFTLQPALGPAPRAGGQGRTG